jgi:hypothetical protein
MRETTAAIGFEFDWSDPRVCSGPTGTLQAARAGRWVPALEVTTEPRPRGVPGIDLQHSDGDVDVSTYHRRESEPAACGTSPGDSL